MNLTRKYELEAFESYRLTDRLTDRQTQPKLYITPLCGWSINISNTTSQAYHSHIQWRNGKQTYNFIPDAWLVSWRLWLGHTVWPVCTDCGLSTTFPGVTSPHTAWPRTTDV